MKHRYPRSSVERLPTISEAQEGDADPDCRPRHTMEEYADSIRELAQPARYPLHGPLRGHRRWTGPLFTTSSGGRASWLPVDPSDVSLTWTVEPSDSSARVKHDQTELFAGLA